MAAVVGELLDEVLVAVAEFVLGHVGKAQRMLREMLDEILELLVGHLGLVGPGGVAEDALQPLRVGGLNGLVGVQKGPADIA